MQPTPIASSKLIISSWITLIMGVGTMLMLELAFAAAYPFVGIPILLLSCWWLLKHPLKVRFFEEEMEVSYFRRKRITPYTTIEYLRFTNPPKSDPTLYIKIAGEKKVIAFEYYTRENLAVIFNIFRMRVKDEDARSRQFVELVEGIYKVKPSRWR